MSDGLISLPPIPSLRRVFTNRTLNLRSISVVGFDMDYTLIHYRTEEWERCAYGHARAALRERGLPVGDLEFVPGAFTLGLVVDRHLGNVVKANRFGFVKRAAHGLRLFGFEEQRAVYSRTIVDLAEPRWEFMNTLFSLSETCLYAQLIELVDQGKLPPGTGYEDVFRMVREAMDAAHMEGQLKRDIMADPERFVVHDTELPLALMDLKRAGKRLIVITNSEWEYVRAMMGHAFDRHVPGGWRSLFDLVVVGARKPSFFTGSSPIFEVVDDTGLLRTVIGAPRAGGAYLGGSARIVEQLLGCPGEDILYVGDHLFADVQVTKSVLRWRTALVVRELEEELLAIEAFRDRQAELDLLMERKEALESQHDRLRVELQRIDAGYGPGSPHAVPELKRRVQELRREIEALDARLAPLSRESSELVNARWGPTMRAGNDKSHFARQVERYADVYTSRVANLLGVTPFAYLRSPRGTLPHDPG